MLLTRQGCSGPVQQHTHILKVPQAAGSALWNRWTRNLGWRKIFLAPSCSSRRSQKHPSGMAVHPTEQTADKQGLPSPTSSAGKAVNHGVPARRAAPSQLPCPFQPSPGQGLPQGPSPSSQRVAAELWASGRRLPQRLSEQCCWVWRWQWRCRGAEEKAEHTRHTGQLPVGLQHHDPSPRLPTRPRPAQGRPPAHHAALQGRFTLLTLAGAWGLSMRRLIGVRGVLPYSISVSICWLFFRCCGTRLHFTHGAGGSV